MVMSDTIKTPIETDNSSVQSRLDISNLEKSLKKRDIQGMSRRKKMIWLLIILLIAAAAGFAGYKKLAPSNSSEFLTTVVTKSTITNSIEATGTLNPVKSTEMGFKNDDTITAINVEAGDHVKAGQVLARQETTTLQTALQQAQSTVEQDQLSVQTSSLNLESNRKTLERQQKLFESGAISQSDLDTAQDNFAKSQLELKTAQAKLANDQLKVEQARSDLSGATLVAPFDGIVGAVNGQVGQINGINSSTSTLLSIISEDLQISALINEADISQIKVGQEAEFTTTAYSNKTFKGKVLRISPQAQTVSNIQYYPVLISCIDPEHQLLAGMSVSVKIVINQKQDVAAIPMMAVTYAQSYIKSHPSGEGSNTSENSRTGIRPDAPKASLGEASTGGMKQGQPGRVLVLQNNKPVIKTVQLGLSDGSNYEVLQGLEPGDKVIVGSSQTDKQSTSGESGSSSNSTRTNRQNQGRSMGGPPPGGF
jgi:HlyD family secretion protein